MLKSQPVIALDIGSTKVACAIGCPSEQESGAAILGTSLVPYPDLRGEWMADPQAVGRAIEQAVEETGVSMSVSRALVTCSCPGLSSHQVRSSVPLADEPVPIRTRDLLRLAQGALDQAVGVDQEPLLVERVRCEGNGFDRVRDPRGLPATRVAGEFHIVTMPMAARRSLVQAVESAGLEPERLVLSLQAHAGGLGPRGSTGRLLLIDVGGSTVDIGLLAEGCVAASTILPWGGVTLALAIAQERQVTMDRAIALSLGGLSSTNPEVRRIIEARLGELAQAVGTLIQGGPLPDQAFVAGRGALIDGVVEWVEQATKIESTLLRHPGAPQSRDLSKQLGLGAALGLLDLGTSHPRQAAVTSPRLLGRVLGLTKTLLTEYF
jgi:Tfp pilus assembly PilM family ATPase